VNDQINQMSWSEFNDVLSSFEMLLERIDIEIHKLNVVGSKSFKRKEYEKVQEVVETAKAKKSIRDKVSILCKEWDELIPTVPKRKEGENDTDDIERITSQSAYYESILKVLYQMGGSGQIGDVLSRVELMMRPILNKVDYEMIRDGSRRCPRWWAYAQFERLEMKHNGWIKDHSPKGVWELTNKGMAKARRVLKKAE